MTLSAGRKNVLTAADGHRISTRNWEPSVTPRAVIQLLHGLGEYGARYARFAIACANAGYATVTHDHRGHGEDCGEAGFGHFADEDGWRKVVEDCEQVRQYAADLYPGTAVIVLGHSMGSFVAQDFAMRHPAGISGLILSSSTFSNRAQLNAGRLIANIEKYRLGRRGKSRLLERLSFGDFNRRFAPNRTAFDWLSRDQDEVDKYVADPLCGEPSTTGLWLDLTTALLEISTAKALRLIPPTMPILLFGGSVDPVGGERGIGRLLDAYRRSGHSNVTRKIYPDGRHEMLNEVNRDKVTADILSWVEST